jgi:alkanesulfonate monooxygenase SsuD/methylene tetrahydromethanopterin reductase-like flavin-dependent oxidoreductase (luciferase family)
VTGGRAHVPAPSIGFLGDVGVDPRGLMDLAREAEAAGFAGAWMVEYEYDSFAFDQALLLATERITVGSCIARYFVREPLLTAETAAVLDLLAPGRFAVGLGSGPMKRADAGGAQQRWGGDPTRTLARMSEYLDVVRRALTDSGDRLSFEGEFFSFADVKLRVRPHGDVPIWLSAGGPKMARLAGRRADGVFVHMVDGDGTRATLEHARAGAVDAGRDPDALRLGNLVPMCVADDGDAAREALRAYLVDYYFHLPHYHRWIAELGFEETANALRAIGHKGDTKRDPAGILADPAARAAAEAVPRELLDRLLIAGTPEECRARYEAIAGWGTDVPILYVFPADGDWAAGYRAAIAAFSDGTQDRRDDHER